MSDVFIYSTMTCSTIFNIYKPKTDVNEMPQVIHSIEIYGGHGMKMPKAFDTPRGVVTRISEADYELLKKEVGFKQQVEAGFLSVDTVKVDPAKKVKDMAQKDGSAPLTPKDFEKGDLSDDTITTYKAGRSKKG